MAHVQIKGLYKRFGSVEILKNINLDIRSGEFVVFVGPSGCGKSTLLRCIAGLEEISDGLLEIDGEVVNHRPPSRRGIAMVFQSYALYPHMNVRDNMSYALKLQKTPRQEMEKKVAEAAEVLQLTPYLDRLPKQLSGGQRQRVAIGRAIVRNPKVFLFDEPLSNLDAALRVSMRIEIAKLHERMDDVTMIYVTHDQVEAMTLADRIVVLRAGLIEQVGTPMELYERPDNLFVAGFIGSPAMNMMPCTFEKSGAGIVVRPEHDEPVSVAADIPAGAIGTRGTLGVRPEHLTLAKGGHPQFRGRLDIIEHLGELTLLYVDCGYEEPIIAKLEGNVRLQRGADVELSAPTGMLHVFDADGRSFRREMQPLAAE